MAIEKDILDQLLAGRDPEELFSKDGLIDELKKALSERLFSLRNARTTPMDRERPDQGLPESMLSMIWKGPFRFFRLLMEASRPIFRTRTPPNVRHIYSRRRIWAR